MTKNGNQRTTVSTLIGTAVNDAEGRLYGHVREIAVAPLVNASHVHGLLVQSASGARSRCLVAIADLELTASGFMQLRSGAEPFTLPGDDTFLLLGRDLLDQQIIDVHGHKVVRVNDVDIVWEAAPEGDGLVLRIAEVEVGLRGAVRRLLKGLPEAAVERIAQHLRSTIIPWDFVDLIDRGPARRVKLKIEQDRLSKMHPSDIADILEDLAPAERQALFVSLDEEIAAETLEEIEPKMQQSLIASLDSEQVAGIVEEMDPAAAADLLSEMTEERSEAILEEMDPEERQEVEDLLEFSGGSAAGRMTTEYLALPPGKTVQEAIESMRDYDGDVETFTEIYLIDEEGRISGLVPIVQLLFAAAETSLEDVPHGHVVTCNVNANGSKVAELFDKYNLRSLPVVDDHKVLLGVIHAEQVIALLRGKR